MIAGCSTTQPLSLHTHILIVESYMHSNINMLVDEIKAFYYVANNYFKKTDLF